MNCCSSTRLSKWNNSTNQECCGGAVYNQADGCCVNNVWYGNGTVLTNGCCQNAQWVPCGPCGICTNQACYAPPPVTNCLYAGVFTGGSAGASPSIGCVPGTVTFSASASQSGGTNTITYTDINCNISITTNFPSGAVQYKWAAGSGSSVSEYITAKGLVQRTCTATATNGVCGPITTNLVAQFCSPDSESSTYLSHGPVVGNFGATITPSACNFQGISVSEQDPGGGLDGCWFFGSPYPQNDHVTGGTWTVGTGNYYSADSIGSSSTAVVDYYRTAGRAPCTDTIPQNMVVDGCVNYYKFNTLQFQIGISTVTATRDSASQTWNYP